ncbi:hypothetical protein HK100_009953 [Physocladia obscura]|uniref:HTH APSES-type domain-containing protein n=1 Tax=Physocladia obscura TaxID=109957 RepID=A0AAD5XKE5_9FUNG|nr:hypothetical protein HK100_009953 [Physocladia obscura]
MTNVMTAFENIEMPTSPHPQPDPIKSHHIIPEQSIATPFELEMGNQTVSTPKNTFLNMLARAADICNESSSKNELIRPLTRVFEENRAAEYAQTQFTLDLSAANSIPTFENASQMENNLSETINSLPNDVAISSLENDKSEEKSNKKQKIFHPREVLSARVKNSYPHIQYIQNKKGNGAVYMMNVSSSTFICRREPSKFPINATQILICAGVIKFTRTKILEEKLNKLGWPNEKLQGGRSSFQGTWVSVEHGLELAREYNMEPILQKLVDFKPGFTHEKIVSTKVRKIIKKPLDSSSDDSEYQISDNELDLNFTKPSIPQPQILPSIQEYGVPKIVIPIDEKNLDLIDNNIRGVPVIELIYKNMSIIRRLDATLCICATHILALVGVDGRKSAILLDEKAWKRKKVISGSLKGVWISIENALELAKEYGVENVIHKLVSIEPIARTTIPTVSTATSAVTTRLEPEEIMASVSCAGSTSLYKLYFGGFSVYRRIGVPFPINLTQLLAIAGVEKSLKIIILAGRGDIKYQFEKFWGGRSSGTWVSVEDAFKFAKKFGVEYVFHKLVAFEPSNKNDEELFPVNFDQDPGLAWLLNDYHTDKQRENIASNSSTDFESDVSNGIIEVDNIMRGARSSLNTQLCNSIPEFLAGVLEQFKTSLENIEDQGSLFYYMPRAVVFKLVKQLRQSGKLISEQRMPDPKLFETCETTKNYIRASRVINSDSYTIFKLKDTEESYFNSVK